MACRRFDSQVVQSKTDTPLGELINQYVPVRITQMDGIDVALYDHDKHNALYYYAINADEEIYLRYGGRDEDSPETYLDLDSLQKALRQGLELHASRERGEWKDTRVRPTPRLPKDNPVLFEEVTERKRCVECHLIADYDMQFKREFGTLDAIRDLFQSPDIQTIGIHLDIPHGLVVESVDGAVKDAGMLPGDDIVSVEGNRVHTFGDLQYYYDKVDRRAKTVRIEVSRNGVTVPLTVTLPDEWWFTDLYFRYWTVEPVVYFWTEPLSDAEKQELELPIEGFASRIVEVDPAAQVYNLHSLKVDDIIISIDGEYIDPDTRYAERHVQLRKEADMGMDFVILRDGERKEMRVFTHMQNFRKAER